MKTLKSLMVGQTRSRKTPGHDLDRSAPPVHLSRRQALGRLALFFATVAATPAMGGNPRPPRCEKGAEQLLALGEYQKALKALPSEQDCPTLKDLRGRYSRMAIQKKMVSATRHGCTAKLAVFQTGQVGAKHVAVLIHGILADHRTWWYVAGALGHDHELWLLDLPGCGQSEGNPADLEPDAFTPAAMAERIGMVLESCLAERSVSGGVAPRLTLVSHSLGALYVLRLLSSPKLRDRFAQVRQHLDALVLFAPCDVAINCLPPSFMPLLSLTPVKVGLGRAIGLVDDKVKALTRKSYFLPECATREQAERFSQSLTVPTHLRGAQAMLRGAVPWKTEENRPDWPAISQLEAAYANVDLPCLIAWGEWDETLTEMMGHKIRDRIPEARLVEITGTGHSVMSERPLECDRIIRTAESAVAVGCFANLPAVSPYGQSPFVTPPLIAKTN